MTCHDNISEEIHILLMIMLCISMIFPQKPAWSANAGVCGSFALLSSVEDDGPRRLLRRAALASKLTIHWNFFLRGTLSILC